MTTPTTQPALCEPVREFWNALRPRRLRSMLDFAEQELVIPSGPYSGFRFSADTMPWSRLILNEFMSTRWRRKFLRGCVQSGKTFLGYVIPALYHIIEREENIIFGAPNAEMAWAKFEEEMIPAIEATRHKAILPRIGAGSRGGRVNSLRLSNGVRLRFMGASGRDEQRSSYTAPVVILTEIDKMDTPGQASRETDPIRQFEARATAYGANPFIYGECTTSVEEGRIYQETTVNGSDSRVYIQCPHCRGYLYPQREHLTGWLDAQTIIEAHQRAAYVCQLCGAAWTESDRAAAVRACVLVHKGQTVQPDGTVIGDLPPTFTLGVVWNAVHSLFVPLGMIAEEEWRAEQNPADESLRRKLSQFTWAIPHKEAVNPQVMSFGLLASRACDVPYDPLRAVSPNADRAPLPEQIAFWTGAVDCQKRVLYIQADAWTADLTRYTLLWSVVEITPEDSIADPTEQQVWLALDRADHILNGIYRCASTWWDTGYKPEGSHEHIIRKWLTAHGDGYNALVGRATSQFSRMTGRKVDLPPEVPDTMIQCRKQDDGSRLWFLDVDKLKDDVYGRLFRQPDAPGAHFFARDAANANRTDRSKGPGSCGWIFSHYMRVKREYGDGPSGRLTRTWIEHGRHDLFDLAAYGLAAAYVTAAYTRPDPEPADEPQPRPQTTIRTSY